MKSVRNLCMAVTCITAGCLLLVGLAEVLDSGIGVGVFWGSRIARRIVALSCCLTVAVGVIWLGWCCLKMAASFTSIAGRIDADNPNHLQRERPPYCFLALGKPVDRFTARVNSRLDTTSKQQTQLESQIRDLQVQVQLSKRQKKNAEAIIYSIRDAVIVVDEFGNLLMANESAGILFNFDYRNSQHQPVVDLIRAEQRDFADLLNRSGPRKGRARRQEIEFLQAGKVKTFDCIVSHVCDEQQQVCGVAAVLHDVTREKEISQMKNDFVSHVSHELRTPLASITAYAEMLCEGEAQDEDTRKEFYSVIQNQAQRLNRLIEDILNISRIESGLIKVEKKPVSLAVLIEEQLQMIRSYAEENGIEIVAQKPIVFDQVYVDKDMMSQVIVNLLSNAVKYTPRGGSVMIASEVDEIGRTIRMKVKDTGVGIPPDEIDHVFDKFYRVGANKAQAKGTGLGLNLVKQIVENVHNGRVFVTSRQGAGSTFGFELPMAAAEIAKAVH